MLKNQLLHWYRENRRILPWREQKDPYLIWISEVMLQQTTVQAVIPYFNRFKERFPNLRELAEADLSEVLAHWAGLGYYSRAKNLHRASQKISALPRFPNCFEDLIELPGFGDYTARAVASIAFDQPVGVVDGNVIRVLSRLTGQPFQWWNRQDKIRLQSLADQMVDGVSPSDMNQALMELGATLCTPTSPACNLCPVRSHCQGHKADSIHVLPLKRPSRAKEIVAVEIDLLFHKNQLALIENTELPFLKGSLLPPARCQVRREKPKKFNFRHSITHYQIFVTIRSKTVTSPPRAYTWHLPADISKINPTSFLRKVLENAPPPQKPKAPPSTRKALAR